MGDAAMLLRLQWLREMSALRTPLPAPLLGRPPKERKGLWVLLTLLGVLCILLAGIMADELGAGKQREAEDFHRRQEVLQEYQRSLEAARTPPPPGDSP